MFKKGDKVRVLPTSTTGVFFERYVLENRVWWSLPPYDQPLNVREDYDDDRYVPVGDGRSIWHIDSTFLAKWS